MSNFILSKFVSILKDIGLYRAIRNVQYGLSHSVYHLFSILEMYNPKSGTLFTPVHELSCILHEMLQVSLLSMGELLCKQIVLMMEELRWMKKQDPQVYETYWEVICHFCIY